MIETIDPVLARDGGRHGIAIPVSLILIAAAASAIPLVVGRVGLPAIVLEILLGVVVGPRLGFSEAGEGLLVFLAELGPFLMVRRFSLRESLAAGVILATRLSVVIALAGLVLDLELITGGKRAGAIMLVAVSAVVSSVALRMLAKPLPSSLGR